MRILRNSNAALKQRWGCWLTWEQILKWQRCVCMKEDRGSVFFFPLTPVYRKTIGHFFLLIRLLGHVLFLPLLLITTSVYRVSSLRALLLAPSCSSISQLPPAFQVKVRAKNTFQFQSFPVLYVLLLFFFFLRLSIYNSGQLRMWSASVNHSTFQPRQRWGKIQLKYIYFSPLKT